MKDFTTKPGDVVLFKNTKINDKSPDHSGFVIAHRNIQAGEKVAISLWDGKPGSSKTLGGKVQDYRTKSTKERALEVAVDTAARALKKSREEDSEIPF